jgi:hypothetical protein
MMALLNANSLPNRNLLATGTARRKCDRNFEQPQRFKEHLFSFTLLARR